VTAEHRNKLDALADAVVAALDGRALSHQDLAVASPALSARLWLRALAVTGKVHICWDARTLRVLPATPAEMDEEDPAGSCCGGSCIGWDRRRPPSSPAGPA